MPCSTAADSTKVLNGRARLPPRLREQVELVLRSVRDDRGHRADRSCPGADRDQRGGRVVALVERVPDRRLREPLVPRDDRRVDLEAAGLNGLRPVLLDQPVANVAEEVRLADRICRLRLDGGRASPRGPSCSSPLSDPGFEHCTQDLVPPSERPCRNRERVVHRGRLRRTGERAASALGAPRPASDGVRRCLDAVGVVAVDTWFKYVVRIQSFVRARRASSRGTPPSPCAARSARGRCRGCGRAAA